MAKKQFTTATTDALNNNNSDDPLASLIGATNKYEAPENTITPKPIEVAAVVAPDDTLGAGEELAITAEQLLQREAQLKTGKIVPPASTSPTPPVSGNGGFSEYTEVPNQEEPPVDPNRAENRRRVMAKFLAKFTDNIVVGTSMAAYSYFVAPPPGMVERKDELIAKAGSLSSQEAQELQGINERLKRLDNLDAQFAESAKMDEDDRAELQECIKDITEVEDFNLHPAWLIVIIVGIQLISNAITIFNHRALAKKV
jgi:hypothetical protein